MISARPTDASTPESGLVEQFVSFSMDGRLLGIPMQLVQEVLPEQTISPVPLARPEIAGLLNLRGQIVTAVNLRNRLGLPDLPKSRASMNVIVRHQQEVFSLLVDEMGDVLNVAGNMTLAPSETLDVPWKSLTSGVIRLEQSQLVILNMVAVLSIR